jgi:hypothetical protein
MTMDSSDDPADTPTEVYEIGAQMQPTYRWRFLKYTLPEAITAARVATDRDGAWDYRIRVRGHAPNRGHALRKHAVGGLRPRV